MAPLEHPDLRGLRALKGALVQPAQPAQPVLLAGREQQARLVLRGLRVLTEMMDRLVQPAQPAQQALRVARGLSVLRGLLALPEQAQRVLLGLPATPGPRVLQDPRELLGRLAPLERLALRGLGEALGLPDQPG